MFERKQHKRFLLFLSISLVPLCAFTAWFNYYIDPMWCFKHANSLNGKQSEIDDRQQKTNLLKFGGKTYDTLIIGNSRVKAINQNDFGARTFNYALSGMIPKEYIGYINYAKRINGGNFKNIVLGLSFAHTNGLMSFIAGKEPSYYFETAEKPFYRYGLLMSGDVFCYSLANLKHTILDNSTHYVDRNNVQHFKKVAGTFDKRISTDLAITKKDYRYNFIYMEQYRNILKSIKKDNPSSKITVFTTPVTQPLYCAMITEGRFGDYKRWLREMVDVFGELYHFEYLNSITRDYRDYYMDGHHFYPEIGTLIAHRIMKKTDNAPIPPDFGMILTPYNIDEKLHEIEIASKVCR